MGNLVVKVQKKGNEVLERTEYTYDTAGNLSAISEEKKEGGNRSILKNAVMTYDADNRLLTYNGETLRYDADGNMTYGPLNGVLTEFRYDSRNRLICAGETTYEYDAENNRIAVETETYRDEYLLDTESTYSQMLVAERTYKDGREETSLYVYGNGLIGEEKETGDRSEYVTYLYNHLGSTTAVTDENGTVVEEYAYGAYGELLTQNPGTRRFLYNGQYGVVTDENGLYHMRARYYNTDIKRFISRDIVSGDITNSQSLNRYCYVQGNPLSYIDPFGLSPESGWGNVGHAILEVLGFIPGWGMIADAVNAIWYAAEGRWMDAAASLISIIPGIGDVIGSSMKSVKAAKVVKGLFYGAGAAGNLWLSGNHISDGVKNLKNALNGEAHEGGIIDNALEVFFGFVNTGLTVAGLAIGLKGLKKLGDATPQIGTKTGGKKGGRNTALTVYDPEFAARQMLVGGETSEDLLRSIVPKGTPNTFVPTATIKDGYKYNFSINGKKVEIKWHSQDLNAAIKYPGSNSGAGWTAQIKVGNKLLTQSGRFVKKPQNYTHIPLKGGD